MWTWRLKYWEASTAADHPGAGDEADHPAAAAAASAESRRTYLFEQVCWHGRCKSLWGEWVLWR